MSIPTKTRAFMLRPSAGRPDGRKISASGLAARGRQMAGPGRPASARSLAGGRCPASAASSLRSIGGKGGVEFAPPRPSGRPSALPTDAGPVPCRHTRRRAAGFRGPSACHGSADIGDRNRLHRHADWPSVQPLGFGRPHQRALERQHRDCRHSRCLRETAPAHRPPRSRSRDVIARHAGLRCAARGRRTRCAAAAPGWRRTASSPLRLGDERKRRHRRKDHDVEPAGMIGHHQHALRLTGVPMHA